MNLIESKNNFLKVSLVAVLIGLLVTFLWQRNVMSGEYVNVMVVLTGGNELDRGEELAPYWLVDAINVGDVDKTINGVENAKVIKMETYEEGFRKVTLLLLKLKVMKDEEMQIVKYKGNDLYSGGVIELHFPKARAYAKVIRILDNGDDFELTYKKVKIRLMEVGGWLVDACKVGDKVMDKKSGQVLAEVLRVNSKPSMGYNSVRMDPDLKTMEVELKLAVRSIEGVDYYALYQPIKVGNVVYIPMNGYNLYNAQIMTVDDDL